MTGNRTNRGIRIGFLLGTVISLFFIPWTLVWAWILPLPDTVQEQAKKIFELDRLKKEYHYV